MQRKTKVANDPGDSWEELAARLMYKHGLHDCKLSIENISNDRKFPASMEDFLGFCDKPAKTIYIDSGIAKCHFRQTVLHEIAHALAPGDPGHGQEWVKTAARIGCTFRHLFPYYLALKK